MERDMDLIRDILLKVAADPELDGSRFRVFDTADFEGHSERKSPIPSISCLRQISLKVLQPWMPQHQRSLDLHGKDMGSWTTFETPACGKT